MQDFSALPKTLAAALSQKGYSGLTPVQEAVSEEALAGKDLLVSAQTGSGKTVGFGLAMAEELLDKDGRFGRPAAPLAVVIAPTRELALQVRREFDWLFAEAGIVTASAVGGMDMRTERRTLERGAHVVIGTPGRLRDHISRGVIDLSDLRTVVLDEADEMLDMGFAEDLEYILDQTPKNRRTLMFSATVPRGIAKLAQTYQKEDAQRIKVGSAEAQHSDITYSALNVAPSDVEKAIINLLCYHDVQTAIVFANTRSMVARLTAKFSNRGFSVVSLSGELSQAERSNAMQALRDRRAQVCVATDVAARGIDLPGLELVIHADLPSNSETLLHRSGRTGRAGRKGTSILIVPGRQRSKAQRLLKTAKLEAVWGVPPSADEVFAREEERIISNPALDELPSAEETAFAERLLKGRTPEQVAAAYLRLYRERHSAPEILSTMPESEKRNTDRRAAFGPSTWFSLSLGRKQRAEPRWLLPMLCRNTGLSKDAIGAIRVQYQETFVEIANDAVPAMKQELGAELTIEQGATLTELAGTPDFDASPKGPPAAPYSSGDAAKYRGPRSGKPPKAARGSEHSDQDTQNAFARPKGKGKPAESTSKKRASKDKSKQGKALQAQPTSELAKAKPQPATADEKQQKRDKNASDPSKPLRARKALQKTNNKASNAPRSKNKNGKGGEARPFRKPSKRN
ncbi:DEAD-box ATP-dependent RNA helicase CshA [Ruegeria denitrificans]|uniref:DEAD-box ATP-dependent RNA helicase CshA n=1 Tax=Ruegeria denitrificans TaxID=1715692 RepID=A0A0P1ICT7_9RHOB|nr:DEAD/DEAH box helicase [Ruegeria denitrificans]CUK05725.1 DEAD-box ATP-dependent RNA helicase CshA [Ruegeria denitrificans]